MSVIADSHDSWCDCDTPFAHLLASIFPPGHRDRLLTVEQILSRDYLQLCHSGGAVAENSGQIPASENGVEGEGIKQEEDLKEENIEDLIAAVEDAERR